MANAVYYATARRVTDLPITLDRSFNLDAGRFSNKSLAEGFGVSARTISDRKGSAQDARRQARAD
jgi:hypothetical protein